jgi:hypothetical protein
LWLRSAEQSCSAAAARGGGGADADVDVAELEERGPPALCGVALGEADAERLEDHRAVCLADVVASAQRLLGGRPAMVVLGLPCSGGKALVRRRRLAFISRLYECVWLN